MRVDAHHSVVEVSEVIRQSCAVRPVVAIVSEAGRRHAVAATSCELAGQILNDGRSVAVVDCDFEAPVLHRLWQRDTSPGLSSVLVGARAVDDVFDYRALATGRFLTVTAGEDSQRRAHLFATLAAEQAIRRLVDFAEIVLVNVGPLSAPHAGAAAALCDAIVVVAAADRQVAHGDRPALLQGLRVPIIAWTPDLTSTPDVTSTPEEIADGRAVPKPVPKPVPGLVPNWIDDARPEAPAPAAAPATDDGVAGRSGTSVPATAVIDSRSPAEVSAPPAADDDNFDIDHLWEPAAPVVAARIPGSTAGSPSETALREDPAKKRKKRKKYRVRTRYMP